LPGVAFPPEALFRGFPHSPFGIQTSLALPDTDAVVAPSFDITAGNRRP